MSEVDQLRQQLEQAQAELATLDDWERVYLSKKIDDLGRPISRPDILVGAEDASSSNASDFCPKGPANCEAAETHS